MISLFLILLITPMVVSVDKLADCLADDKYCVGLPRDCLGTACNFQYSAKSNGKTAEIEIFGTKVQNREWLAIGYSDNKKMENDFVMFCARDDAKSSSPIAGLAYNQFHKNTVIGFIDNGLEHADNYSFDLKLLDFKVVNDKLYCKLSHAVAPLIENFNTTKYEILMAKGLMIKDALTYHSKAKADVGVVDLSGVKKQHKKNGATTGVTILAAAISFIVYTISSS